MDQRKLNEMVRLLHEAADSLDDLNTDYRNLEKEADQNEERISYLEGALQEANTAIDLLEEKLKENSIQL
jgi:uncharacterized protein YaaN involved in tellurite resistance